MPTKIKSLVAEIRALHEKLAPVQVKEDQVEPATDAEIVLLEKMIQDKLPPEFVEFLQLQTFEIRFDGMYSNAGISKIIDNLASMNKLLNAGAFDDGRVEECDEYGNFDGSYIKKAWWNPKWVPFIFDSCANMKCIDLDPGKRGVKGQIMKMEIQDSQGPFADKYENFTDWLQSQSDLLEEERYRLEDFGDNEFRLILDRYA